MRHEYANFGTFAGVRLCGQFLGKEDIQLFSRDEQGHLRLVARCQARARMA